MSPARILPLVFLAAASGLEAQTVTLLGGGLGAFTVDNTQSISTTGNIVLGVGLEVEYLVVGGGGGGGGGGSSGSAWGTGGGGAGGMLTGTKVIGISSTAAQNVLAVSVGAGGAGGQKSDTPSLQQGSNGGNSAFLDVSALGGGGGGGNKLQGGAGGSGGGGGGRGTGNNLRTPGGAGTAGQGFAGGATRDDDSTGRSAGGGGGGAGGLGGTGGTDTTVAGNGGVGLASSITGTSVLYAGGGGGGAIDTNLGAGETPGTGGSGIGGNGSISGNAGSGAANTGSGGGGVGTNGVGGSGGSGLVVLRYRTAAVAGAPGTGGTVAAGAGTAAGYTVHSFTAAGSSSLDLSGLDLANNRMVTKISGAFTGSGVLAFNSASVSTPSTFILTGNSTGHTGVIAINDRATVQVGDGGASGTLGSGTILVNQGSALVFDRSDNLTVANKISGNVNSGTLLNQGGIIKRGSGALVLTGLGYNTGNAGYFGRIEVQEGSLEYDASGWVGSYMARAQVSAGASFTLRDRRPAYSGLTGWYGMGINTSGEGQLVLQGTTRITLASWGGFVSGLAHTGGTVIDGTDLSLADSALLVAGSNLTIRGGGRISGSANHVLGQVLIENGAFYGSSLAAGSLTVQTGGMVVSLANATALTKTGSGEFALASANANRTGATRVEDGILRVATATSLGQGAVTVAGGTLRLAHGYDTNPAVQKLTTLVLDGGTVETTSARLTHLDASVLDLRSGTLSLRLEGKGALTKTTAGTVILGGNNTRYAGNVTVSDGVLRLLTTTGLGTNSTVLLEGGTIELAGNTRVGYFEQTGGSVTGGTLVSSLILTESGTFGSALADDVGGASGILKRTAGTTEVTAANTFTGGINVQAGTLRLAGAGAFNAAARLIASAGGTLDLGGKAQTLAGIDGDGAIALGTGGALTVASNSLSSTFTGAISGDGTLTKSGTGVLALSGANTHTGGTSVLGGTLVVNGTLGSGTVGVASGATLGGSGTIAGATVISGTHSPGNSPGLQTFTSSLTYQSGAQVRWELASQSDLEADRGVLFDGIDVAGDLTFSGPVTVDLTFALAGSSVDWTDTFWADAHTWKLFDVGGSIIGIENLSLLSGSLLLDADGASLADTLLGAAFSLNVRSGDVFIDYIAPAPIPEPSTYGIILGGLALAGAALRRRARRHGATAARN